MRLGAMDMEDTRTHGHAIQELRGILNDYVRLQWQQMYPWLRTLLYTLSDLCSIPRMAIPEWRAPDLLP